MGCDWLCGGHMFSFAGRDWREGRKSSLRAKKVRLRGRQQQWQIETREKGLHIEKRVDRGDPVIRELKNYKRPGFVPAFGIHAVLAKGRGTAGSSRHQPRSPATTAQTEHPDPNRLR